MSWTVDLNGTAEFVKDGLASTAERMRTAQHPGAAEFEEVRPMLESLVDFNAPTDTTRTLRLVASGHANTRDGTVNHKYCDIRVEPTQKA